MSDEPGRGGGDKLGKQRQPSQQSREGRGSFDNAETKSGTPGSGRTSPGVNDSSVPGRGGQSPLQRSNTRKGLNRSISDMGKLERQSSSIGRGAGACSSGS